MADLEARPPGRDPELWGEGLFTKVKWPVDWCTVRQAQELLNRHDKPQHSLLRDIAEGKIVSAVYTPDEAQKLLDILISKNNK